MMSARANASGLAAITLLAITSALAAEKPGRADVRKALAGDHDTSPAGVTRRLRNATLLAESWPLEELPTITKAVADIDLAATLPQSFDLLAALGRTKSPRVLPLLVRGLAVDVLKNHDDQIGLGDGGVIDRMQALQIIFAPYGADVCKLLPPRLENTDDHTAAMAAGVLGQSRCREARPLLRKWAESRDPLAYGYAMLGLGSIGDAADRPLLLQRSLEAKPDYRRSWAARGLAEMGDGASTARLIELLPDRDPFVRDPALEVLFRAPDARALAALIAQRKSDEVAADADELLAALALEAGVPAQALNANAPQATLDDVAARIARSREAGRKKAAQALPGSDDIPKILAAQGAILARHDARWLADIRPWDDALVHAARKRAGLPDAYASTEEMVDLLERRCRAGGAQSCLRAARIMQFQTRLDAQRAMALDHRGCELGLDRACFDEPGFYETGRGVRQDAARAARMFRALCDKGMSRACMILGMYKWRGTDGKPDPKASYQLCFSPAPDARWAHWCAQAGQFATAGDRDTPGDPALAARLFRRACELGDRESCARAADPQH